MINIHKFEKIRKIKFKNKSLLIMALTHKSANKEVNNEKLEFLGDRVLGLVLSKKLYDLYPVENEGILDKKLASLVKRKTCSNVSWSIGIQNFIITGSQKKKILITDDKILSDCCEAVIGAIFIDRGFEASKNYILKIWKKEIDKSNITILDPKTKLQEFSLKTYKKLPIYRIISSTGPRHNPIYRISVSIINSKQYIGSGNSKQMAELDAANKLLKDKKIN